jgi:hypothetical protein
MLFFFFTLQNKGVPVNEMYESEGIKAIRTDRFDEIMGQIAQENNAELPIYEEEEPEQYSFYSDDSYSLIVKEPDPAKIRKRPGTIPPLDFENLPSYETTSEEDEEQQEEPVQKNVEEY